MPRQSSTLYHLFLSNRSFRILLLEHFISHTGYYLVSFSSVVLIYKLTASNTAVSLLLFNSFLPSVILSLLAGVVADMKSRRRVIMITDLLWALSVMGLFAGRFDPFMILIITFIAQGVDEFFRPAQAAMLPSLLAEKDLIPGNSLFSFVTYGAAILGYSTAGSLLKLDQGAPFIVASGLGLLSVFIAYWLPDSRGSEKKASLAETVKMVKTHLRQGINYLFTKIEVAQIVLFLGAFNGVFMFTIGLMPGFASQNLKIDPTDLSLIMVVPLALGAALGSIVLSKHHFRWPNVRWIGWGALGVGLSVLFLAVFSLLFSQTPPIVARWVLVVLSFIIGSSSVCVLIPSSTSLQMKLGDTMRGRAYGVLSMTTSLITGFFAFSGGPLADILGSAYVLVFLGLAISSFRWWQPLARLALVWLSIRLKEVAVQIINGINGAKS